jgi:hypothetical protein
LNFLDYGARMYDDFLGRWFVQDPLQEQRPWISSYVFCSNNPIGRIDPNGLLDDGYTVDDYGYIEKVNNEGGEKYDVIYKKETYTEENKENYDESGESGGLQISKGIIQSDKPLASIDIETKKTTGENNRYEIKSDKEATKIFEFMSKNTKVEWVNTYMKDSKGNEFNFLMTSHAETRVKGVYSRLSYIMRTRTAKIIRTDHIHPGNDSRISAGDNSVGLELQRLQLDNEISFRIFTNGKYYPYKPKQKP